MATLQDARDKGYNILKENQDANAYPLDLFDELCNTVELRIATWQLSNAFNEEPVIKKGKLPFLQETVYYQGVVDTSLSADAVAGGTTLTVADTTSYPSSGAVYLNGNIIPYTGTTSTTFTGCSNILYNHLAGSQVGIAYDLPSDYMAPIQLVRDHNYRIQSKPFDQIWEDINNNKGYNERQRSGGSSQFYPRPLDQYYAIKDASYIIPFNTADSATNYYMFRYIKEPTALTTGSSTLMMPDDRWALATTPYLAVGEMLYNRGEEKRAAELLNFAYKMVKEAFIFYNSQTNEQMTGKHVQAQKRQLNVGN